MLKKAVLSLWRETAAINMSSLPTVSGGLCVDKGDFLKWSRKYDKDQGWLAQKEKELGARFRKTKVMTHADLAAVIEFK